MTAVAVEELQGIELLAGFSQDELTELAGALEVLELAAGEAVFSAGGETRALYLVLSGKVEIELIGEIVEETNLAELGPMDVFGESTFFHPAVHQTTARCVEDTRLAVLTYETYETMLGANSPIAYHLGANAAHILAARLQATDQWIREVLDYDEQQHRHSLHQQYMGHFQSHFSTPSGFVGLGVNW